MDRDRRQFTQGVEMPNHFEEVFLRKHLIGVTGQKQKQVEFLARQGNFPTAAKDLMPFDKDTQISDLDIWLAVICFRTLAA